MVSCNQFCLLQWQRTGGGGQAWPTHYEPPTLNKKSSFLIFSPRLSIGLRGLKEMERRNRTIAHCEAFSFARDDSYVGAYKIEVDMTNS